MKRHSIDPQRERGQVLFVFALVLVAIVAMTGLVLDGGSTFVQRRDMQNVADAASMAGAYDYTTNASITSAIAAAQKVASDNGFTNGSGGVNVSVSVAPGTAGAWNVVVGVDKPHRNSFSGIVGLASWGVSTTATAQSGAPNGANGAMPIIFNESAFPGGWGPASPVSFDEPGTGTQDVPQGPNQFNWTVFCTANGNPCNGDSSTVSNLIDNEGESTTVTLDKSVIGPLNAGTHTTLFSGLADYVGAAPFPVAIVDNSGKMKGWAMFQLTGSVGGSTKQISGFFVDKQNSSSLVVVQGGGNGTTNYGSYVVKLIN